MKILLAAVTVLAVLVTLPFTAAATEPRRPVHTYSIVARDASTGELGVAVQSHWFSVGSGVLRAEPGIGAVATQSFLDPRTATSMEQARAYSGAAKLVPDNHETVFWHAVTLASAGREEEALPLFAEAFERWPRWRELVQRLPASGLLPDDPDLMRRIVAVH